MDVGMKTMAAMGAVLLCAAGTAAASPETVLQVKVPFAFEVNGHSLPTGRYLIQRDDMTSPSARIIRGASRGNHEAALSTTRPDNARIRQARSRRWRSRATSASISSRACGPRPGKGSTSGFDSNQCDAKGRPAIHR